MTKRVTLAASTRTWTMRLATSADGSLHAQLQPGSDDMTLRAQATGELLARGAWSSSGAKTFDFNVCGQRSLLLRVSRHSTARRFTLRLSTP